MLTIELQCSAMSSAVWPPPWNAITAGATPRGASSGTWTRNERCRVRPASVTVIVLAENPGTCRCIGSAPAGAAPPSERRRLTRVTVVTGPRLGAGRAALALRSYECRGDAARSDTPRTEVVEVLTGRGPRRGRTRRRE